LRSARRSGLGELQAIGARAVRLERRRSCFWSCGMLFWRCIARRPRWQTPFSFSKRTVKNVVISPHSSAQIDRRARRARQRKTST